MNGAQQTTQPADNSAVTAELRHRFGPTVGFHERDGLFTVTGVVGVDPATGELAGTPEEQFRQAFANARAVSGVAGFALSEVGRVTVFTPDARFRPLINPPWLELFPDDADRPARKTTHIPLAADTCVELQLVGVRSAARRPVEIDGVRHRDPLPMGARLGRYLFSSVIPPDLPGGGKPAGVAAIEQAFRNMAALLTAAGGSQDDIADVWVYLGRWDLHPDMVDIWVSTFPRADSRPTRKTFYYPRVDIQLQCVAFLGGARANFEIPGLGHHDPIPMGALTGDLFTSSGLDGRDPATGHFPRGVTGQAEHAVDNMDRLLAEADVTPDALVHVTGLVGDRRYIPELERVWRSRFADDGSAPAFETMELGLPARDMLVQLIVRGVVPGH